MGVFAAFAQLTFTGNAYYSNAKNFDLNFQYANAVDASSVVVPTAGNNQVYDYTNVVLNTPYGFTLPLNSVPTLITNATHQSEGLSDDISSSLALTYYNLMYKLDATGVYLTGWAIPESSLSLGGTDSIKIGAQYATFNKNIYIQKFPMTVGASINDNQPSVINYNFTISVAAYNLSNAPAVRRQYITQKDSIVGWGVFKRKSPSGVLLSDTVLMSSRIRTTVDSFFLSGSPAPAALVGFLGAAQGRTTFSSRLSFLEKNRAIAVMYLLYPNATFTGPPSASTFEFGDALRTPTADLSQAVDNVWNVYPNPVTDRRIYLTYSSGKDVTFSIVNALGQTMEQMILPANSLGLPTSVLLKNSMPAGLYFGVLHGEKDWKSRAIYIR